MYLRFLFNTLFVPYNTNETSVPFNLSLPVCGSEAQGDKVNFF